MAAEAGAAPARQCPASRRPGPSDARLPWFWDVYTWLAWERARGWVVSQAVIALAYYTAENNGALYHEAEAWLDLVLSEPAS